jgi:hypothetical protein
MSSSTSDQERAAALAAFACVVGRQKAIYVSGPITTGRTFVDWAAGAPTDDASPPTYLRIANETAIVAHAEKLRLNGRIVIEPSSFGLPCWSQRDYHELWIEVIARYAAEMVVLDAWEYSLGCVLEFRAAVRAGIPVVAADETPISEDLGRERVRRAVELLESTRSRRLSAFAKRLRDAVA